MSRTDRRTQRRRPKAMPAVEPKKKPVNKVYLGVTCTLVIVLGGGLTAIALNTGSKEVPVAEPIVQPEPWQYDAVADRHFDPVHGHWHEGPPPVRADGSFGQAGDGVAAPPNITNAKPWQYDEASDRHYDPGHAHWHSGPPPPGVDETVLTSPVRTDRVDAPPGVINPTPWQYDAATDRHYDPGHRHWHSGPPPAGR